MKYAHLVARLFNTPLMIAPNKLDAIIAGLGPRFGLGPMDAPPPAPDLYTRQRGDYAEAGYRVTDNGVAVVDVFGILAHRTVATMTLAESSYILGYETIGRRLDAALADPAVRAVLLNIDSPGGEVAGAFDLAAQIREARGAKPLAAAIADYGTSAAYLIAAATGDVSVTQTGWGGSVGVASRHVDFSAALAAEGIVITQIFAGARKVDGHPYGPLPDAVRADFQAQIDEIYGQFVDAIAADRGMTAADVRATEAGIYRGAANVGAGFADRVATPDQIIARLGATRSSTLRGTTMDKTTPNPTLTAADIETAHAEGQKIGYAEGLTDGKTQGRAESTARIKAILTHEEAAGRDDLARSLALETDLQVESAAAVLASAAKVATGNPFAQAMDAMGNPAIGPGDGDGEDDDAATSSARKTRILRQIGLLRTQ